ncbi:propionyl-CoA synthetase [Haliea sp. AH-315-K21]|uniref:Propionyl-CoA synthetase n=1 Tax=SAR86 cluster bacterium TaxID=2030880 RepID=A0A2A5CHA5_9GAMM|nr:propionyl-CoA synthetase [Haliea sp. AH-315-K21]PCJ42881.1 MAG: propionyl-CoA synthetase [SAR86 cluster bacterium]
MSYQQEYQSSIDDPAKFWEEKAKLINWYKFPKNILSTDEQGIERWYADGELNTCYLALDYHIENGRGEQLALIYDSPVTDQKRTYTYLELRDEVARCAGMLKHLGVEKGDRVIIYLPMVPEAAISMLACARLGAIHSVVFGGFASPELALRLDDFTPKVLLTASCGIEVNRIIEYKPLVDEAISLASHKPQNVVVLQREQAVASMHSGIDLDWATSMQQATPADCVPVLGTDLLYILYTSGTTGKPKGVVRENGGHAVAMKYSMKAIYDIEPGDVFWAASDVGWVVGHSYIVYAPLLHGCTTILYEGKPVMTPDAGAFWRVISEYKVKAIFSAPTAYRAIKKEDPEGELARQYDLSCLKTIFAAGERLDPPTYEWLRETYKLPVIDHWWQTETGWAMASNLLGIERMPAKPGSATMPVPGFNIDILDDEGQILGANEQGFIGIKLPLPPSCLTSIWGDTERFKESYLEQFPGYFSTGDGGYFDDDGYLYIMGRVDDVINVAGHRLSTGEMEEIVGKHPMVAECAVIGRSDELKGQMPMGFVVIKNMPKADNSEANTEIVKQLIQMVREEIGPVAAFKEALIVSRLPKTRSGKILRKTLRAMVDGDEYTIPSTIEDPAALDEIKALL